jgi:hypothetical protein
VLFFLAKSIPVIILFLTSGSKINKQKLAKQKLSIKTTYDPGATSE